MAPDTAVVSQALLHHKTSINSLQLPRLQSGALVNLLPAISQLSHLTRLQLTIPHHRPQDDPTIRDTIDGLASTISNLPSLQDVALQMNKYPQAKAPSPPPRKIPKLSIADSISAPLSFDPIIQALATATSLTSLAFLFAIKPEYSTPFPCSGITGPFRALQQLTIELCSTDPVFRSIPPSHRFPHVSPLPALTSLAFICGYVHRPHISMTVDLTNIPENAAPTTLFAGQPPAPTRGSSGACCSRPPCRQPTSSSASSKS